MAIELSETAAREVKTIIEKEELDPAKVRLRVGVKGGGCSGFSYVLDLTETEKDADEKFERHGVQIVCDPKSYLYLNGATIDFRDEIMAHQKNGGSWQHNLEKMLKGAYEQNGVYRPWMTVDVRDDAACHVGLLESVQVKNGERYIACSTERRDVEDVCASIDRLLPELRLATPTLTDPFPERLNGQTSLFTRAEMLSSQREFIASSGRLRISAEAAAVKKK